MPFLSRGPRVPHYHGDGVRVCFIATAILSVVVIPIWGEVLPFGLFAEVGSIILLVFLAGLTNPHSKLILGADVLVAGVGAFLLEIAAVSFYSQQSFVLFAAREMGVVFLLFALYHGVKTIRAMFLGQIGHIPSRNEFDTLHKL